MEYELVKLANKPRRTTTLAVTPKGYFNSETQYVVGDVVTHENKPYMAYSEPPVGTSPLDMEYWQPFVPGAVVWGQDD